MYPLLKMVVIVSEDTAEDEESATLLPSTKENRHARKGMPLSGPVNSVTYCFIYK